MTPADDATRDPARDPGTDPGTDPASDPAADPAAHVDQSALAGDGGTAETDASRIRKQKKKKKAARDAAPAAPLPASALPAAPLAAGAPSDDSAAPPLAGPAETKRRKDKAKPPAPEPDEGRPLGTTKAVETMFRNAVRAELDIIALAATKANIMISLNGFIISALMISGAFLFNSSPGFLLPAGVFMLTSAASIIFALLAASPERAHYARAFLDWATAVRERRAGLRDLRGYFDQGSKTQPDHDLNLLIYEDRARMDPDDYWDRMQTLLRDRDDIYRKMSDQLYWLGQMAARKFKMLNVSYTCLLYTSPSPRD